MSIQTTTILRTNHKTPRVMRWRLLIKEFGPCLRILIGEFGPELIYLPGVNNVVADCISRLKYEDNNDIMNHFELDKEDINAYPLSYKLIMKYQQKDNKLVQKVKTTQRTVYVPSL